MLGTDARVVQSGRDAVSGGFQGGVSGLCYCLGDCDFGEGGYVFAEHLWVSRICPFSS
jgi:hypothetical protein